ncbi:MAG: carboxypeptidase-like regulatory domain-containing protein, partial [Acidobacteriota bacterium]
MRNAAALTFVLLLVAAVCAAEPPEEPAFGALTGNVSSSIAPLALSKVYAYQLSGQQLTKVATDQNGNFQFERLPAGLYKIIAFKDGFVPAIALLSRSTSDAFQYLRLELYEEDAKTSESEDGFWAIRQRIPGDVLRDIEVELAALNTDPDPGFRSTHFGAGQIDAEMSAIAGVDQNLELGSASVAGGRVDIEGAISEINVGLSGDYVTLQPVPGSGSSSDLLANGRSQNVSLA